MKYGLLTLLILSACTHKNPFNAPICSPVYSDEYLRCENGNRFYNVDHPEGYFCTKTADFEFYIENCLRGLPVPEISVCVYSDDKTITCDTGSFPAAQAVEYVCTSRAGFERITRRCVQQDER